MHVTQFLAHSIEEYDQLRLLTALGHDVFSPGAYIRPHAPADNARPGVPEAREITALTAVVDALGGPDHPAHGACNGADAHADPSWAAKENTPDEIIEWTDVLIVHHLEHTWLDPQYERWAGKRIIWRTVGQSAHPNEHIMGRRRGDGLQIVRYSPLERNIPGYAGEDALIRFYKDPAEWNGWIGGGGVGNVTQDLYRRSLADDGTLQPAGWQFTNYSFWEAATAGLPRVPAGPGSEKIGGVGQLGYDRMREYLREIGAYVYTGTQPASYTLGLIEAMMTGVPVVSIPPSWMRIMPYGAALFEGAEIAVLSGPPSVAHNMVEQLLAERHYAEDIAAATRARALELFDRAIIARQWKEFLDG